MAQEALKMKRYWLNEDDPLEPIDWKYFDSLPKKIKLGLELYMEGRVSLGKAAEVAGLPVTEFDYIRGRTKIPLRGPDD
ncbi:MAG: hypothetical protein AOA65_1869 [Candidatus Bathyarchaeota archaeon BA1]|nr:MAG: hypothetical protein AOA65_1869 [Candidatus Bathyarchaeota archaeon BA1]